MYLTPLLKLSVTRIKFGGSPLNSPEVLPGFYRRFADDTPELS
jgi:hypothetical protein